MGAESSARGRPPPSPTGRPRSRSDVTPDRPGRGQHAAHRRRRPPSRPGSRSPSDDRLARTHHRRGRSGDPRRAVPVSRLSRCGSVGVAASGGEGRGAGVRPRRRRDRRDASGVMMSRADRAATARGRPARTPVRIPSPSPSTTPGFAGAYGGDWACRLRLVQLPPCAPDHARREGLRPGRRRARWTPRTSFATPLPRRPTSPSRRRGRPDAAGGRPPTPPAGPNGDYTATSLSPASTWQVSQQTGALLVEVPDQEPARASADRRPRWRWPTPSQAVDGQTWGPEQAGARGSATGGICGPASSSGRTKSCLEDTKAVGGKDPNNTENKTGDQCWWKPNATMSAERPARPS